MASKMAISSPGSTIITSRGARNVPPPPSAGCVPAALSAPAGPPCSAGPDPVPGLPVGSATDLPLTRPAFTSPAVSAASPGSLTYRPASYYARAVTNRPSSKKERPEPGVDSRHGTRRIRTADRHQGPCAAGGARAFRRAGVRENLAAGDRRGPRCDQGCAVLPLQVQG